MVFLHKMILWGEIEHVCYNMALCFFKDFGGNKVGSQKAANRLLSGEDPFAPSLLSSGVGSGSISPLNI